MGIRKDGSDESVQYLDGYVGFTGVHMCQTYQIVHFRAFFCI